MATPPVPRRLAVALDSWTLFLLMLFAIVGLCGLFASYAVSIPLERGAARLALLEETAAQSRQPGANLQALRPRLDTLAPIMLDSPAPLETRLATARARVHDEQDREEASLAYRTRLMLGIVTLISAVLGAGILHLARRTPG